MDNRAVITGVVAGMGAMYILDPQRGHRRRTIFRDKAVHYKNKGSHFLVNASHDLSNRVQGLIAELQASMKSADVPDVILTERVRSRLGHVCSHPSAIEVHCSYGIVTLQGPILAAEYDRILSEVASVRGVKEVREKLELHESNENIPALQGGRRTSRYVYNLSPGLVLGSLVGIVGTALVSRYFQKSTFGRYSAKIMGRKVSDRIRGLRPRFWNINESPRESGLAA